MTDPERTSKQLRALLVEDDLNDAELVLRELRRGGYEPLARRVETAGEMRAALNDETWDVVISDHSLPTFSAPEAFALLKSLNLDVPFIIVSGTVGEDIAVEAMRTGIHDFLLKGQLRRLVAAIERELREAAIRAERRKIQEQLLISDRMASVGTLAAGVAHEINNPLSVVVGNLQILGQDVRTLAEKVEALPPTSVAALGGDLAPISNLLDSIREATRDAEEAADRVRIIVRDLRVFSRSEEDIRDSVDVHRVLESSIRMARNEIRHRAKVVRRFGNVPGVHANEARLGQVFLNLIVNAAQAIKEGDTEHNSIAVSTYRQDGMVAVEITDTGSGIPPDVLPRIFDMFYTTKPVGTGTGLGLAICHRILTSMEGRIDVQSKVGEGTTVRVLLPRARSGRTMEVPIAQPATPAPPRSRSILVVEDEAAIGRVLQRLLTPHRVTPVTRAREALDRITTGEEFDLILCDIMMPELTGMDFHARLRTIRPALADQIIFMSGGAFTPGARAFLEKVPNRRIEKPIDASRLRRLVEEALGHTKSA